MKEKLEQHRRRLTANEKATVWSNIRSGGESRSLSPWTWMKWAAPIGGLATVFLFALIMADKMPGEPPVGLDSMKIAEHRASQADETAWEHETAWQDESRPFNDDTSLDKREDGTGQPTLREKNDSKPAEGIDKDADIVAGSAVGSQLKDAGSSPAVLAAPAAEPPVAADEIGAGPDTGAGIRTRSLAVEEMETRLNVPEADGDLRVRVESDALERAPEIEVNEAARLSEEVVLSSQAVPGPESHVQGGRASELGIRPGAAQFSVSSRQTTDADASEKKVKTWGNVKSFSVGSESPKPAPGSPVVDEAASFAHGGQTPPNDDVYDGMFFQNYGANPLLLTEMDPLSTFAVDVDNGAYTLMRSYIERGSLPDRNSPRVEEYVNFFDPGYADVTGRDFEIHVDGAPSPFGAGFELLRVGLQARTIADEDRKPANLTFVIDVSGSMNRENRLGLVKQSLYALLDALRPEDQVAIVAYGSRAQLVLEPSSLEDRGRIREAIAQLTSNGSTNAEEGLVYGYNIARSMYSVGTSNRIVLCSDGVANVGRTGPDSILERVRTEATTGIYLTTVGFGMGNYNDVLMEQLANKGDGTYYYVDRLEEAERVFTENLTGMLQVVARDAKIQVEFDPEQVLAYRLIGFENREIADKDFRNDTVDAGEIGSGHQVVALYEIRLRSNDGTGTPRELGQVRFRYAEPEPKPDGSFVVHEIAQSVSTSAFAREFNEAPVRLRLAAVVAEYSEILRHSYWSQNHSLAELLPLVEDVAFYLRRDEEVTEFARLVGAATQLAEKLSPEDRQKRWPALDAVSCIYPVRTNGQVDWAQWNCDR